MRGRRGWLPVLLFLVRGVSSTAISIRVLLAIPVGLWALRSVDGLPRLRMAGRDVVSALRREGRDNAVTNGRARCGGGGGGN